MSSDQEASIRAALAGERRSVRRLTWRLLTSWRAKPAQRTRWRALRAGHKKQVARWREELRG